MTNFVKMLESARELLTEEHASALAALYKELGVTQTPEEIRKSAEEVTESFLAWARDHRDNLSGISTSESVDPPRIKVKGDRKITAVITGEDGITREFPIIREARGSQEGYEDED